MCDTANVGIDPISSKYRASIADTDSNTCHLKKKNIHLNDQQQLKKINNTNVDMTNIIFTLKLSGYYVPF